MNAIPSQITSLFIACSTVDSGADQRRHLSYTSLAFVKESHRWPVNSVHKRPVTRKMFPFDDVIIDFKSWVFRLICTWRVFELRHLQELVLLPTGYQGHILITFWLSIVHTTFSNAFSWMKIYQFRLRFKWNLLLWAQFKLFQHWSR